MYILKMFHFGVFLMMELNIIIIAEIVEVTIMIYGDNVVKRLFPAFPMATRWTGESR